MDIKSWFILFDKIVRFLPYGVLILCAILSVILIMVSLKTSPEYAVYHETTPQPEDVTIINQQQKEDLEKSKHYIKLLEADLKLLSTLHAKRVTVTFYCPSEGGINGSPDKTASGDKPIPGWTIAVSRDLIEQGFYGQKIDICDTIPGKFRGVHFSHDKMAVKDPYTGKLILNRIDICVGSLKDIPKEGIFHDVLISKIFGVE